MRHSLLNSSKVRSCYFPSVMFTLESRPLEARHRTLKHIRSLRQTERAAFGEGLHLDNPILAIQIIFDSSYLATSPAFKCKKAATLILDCHVVKRRSSGRFSGVLAARGRSLEILQVIRVHRSVAQKIFPRQ